MLSRIRMKKIIALITLYFSVNTVTFANPTQEVSELLSRYESFSGFFEQSLVDDKGQNLQTLSGEFMIKRPGLFRWETYNPYPQLLVSDLKTLWLFDPDLEQVTVRPFDNQASQSPALLLSGDADNISTHYQVTSIETNRRYELIPTTSNNFSQMELLFENAALSQIIVLDSLDQTTTFTFSDIKTNQTFLPSLFEFDIPDGVDVLIDE